MAKRSYNHFFRLNPVERRTHTPAPEWRAYLGFLLDLPPILFWLTLTLSSVFRINRPFQAIFEHFVASPIGTAVLYFTNLIFPVIAISLGILAYNRRSRKTDLSTAVIGISGFLLLLILVYSFGRLSHR